MRLGSKPKRDNRLERYLLPEQMLMAAPIPKVASRTIKGMFEELSDQKTTLQINCSPENIQRDYGDYFIFSCVRNPWSRAYSCWKDKIADAYTPGKVSIISRFPHLRPFMQFEEFVEWLESEHGSDATADRHWLSQVHHLTDKEGKNFCDYIGRIEHLEEGFSDIEKLTGITLPRITARNVKASALGYEQAYNTRTKAIIERRYCEDIETFGYRFS